MADCRHLKSTNTTKDEPTMTVTTTTCNSCGVVLVVHEVDKPAPTG